MKSLYLSMFFVLNGANTIEDEGLDDDPRGLVNGFYFSYEMRFPRKA